MIPKRKTVAGSVKVRFLKDHMVNNPKYNRRTGPDVPSFVCINVGEERELPRSQAEALAKCGAVELLKGSDGG